MKDFLQPEAFEAAIGDFLSSAAAAEEIVLPIPESLFFAGGNDEGATKQIHDQRMQDVADLFADVNIVFIRQAFLNMTPPISVKWIDQSGETFWSERVCRANNPAGFHVEEDSMKESSGEAFTQTANGISQICAVLTDDTGRRKALTVRVGEKIRVGPLQYQMRYGQKPDS
jgi:hypothetical protein